MPRLPVLFQKGISRLANSDVSRPYHLENSEIVPSGQVRALRSPAKISGGERALLSQKPYVEWNGGVMSRDLSAVEAGRKIAAMDKHGRVLCASTFKGDLSATVSDPKTVAILPTHVPGSASGIEAEPARVVSVVSSLATIPDVTLGPSTSRECVVGYLAIPVNSRGEAGEWRWFSANTSFAYQGEDQTLENLFPHPLNIEIKANQPCTILLYRTMTLDRWGFVAGSLGQGVNSLKFERGVIDDDFYYAGRYETVEQSGGHVAKVYENRFWINDYLLGKFWPDAPREIKVDNTGGTEQVVAAVREVPSSPLDRRRNFHTSVGGVYRGFAARAMYDHGGKMLYGNVMWPLKAPQVYAASGSGSSFILRYEYDIPGLGVVYGPATNVSASGKVAWQGERALVVIIPGTNVIAERMTPDVARGVYVTSAVNEAGEKTNVTFHSAMDDNAAGNEVFSGTVVDYVTEPNVVLISAQDRPLELTSDQFVVDDDEVLAILPPRVEEEDSSVAYDIVVVSTRYVIGYQRLGDAYVEAHRIRHNLGVHRRIDSSEDLSQIIAEPVSGGLCLCATSGRPYFMTGRRMIELDREVPEVFTSNIPGDPRIIDMAFDTHKNDLWVLLSSGVIWVYSFEQEGWYKQYDFSKDTDKLIHLYYRSSARRMMALARSGGALINYVFDESGALRDPLVVTQPITEGQVSVVPDTIKLEYDRAGYDPAQPTTWAKLRHSIRHDNVLQWDDALGSKTYEFEVPAARRRPVHLRMAGQGHQFSVSRFDVLREIILPDFVATD